MRCTRLLCFAQQEAHKRLYAAMHVMSTRTLRRIAMQEDSLGRVDRLSHLVRRAVRETTSLQLKPLGIPGGESQ